MNGWSGLPPPPPPHCSPDLCVASPHPRRFTCRCRSHPGPGPLSPVPREAPRRNNPGASGPALVRPTFLSPLCRDLLKPPCGPTDPPLRAALPSRYAGPSLRSGLAAPASAKGLGEKIGGVLRGCQSACGGFCRALSRALRSLGEGGRPAGFGWGRASSSIDFGQLPMDQRLKQTHIVVPFCLCRARNSAILTLFKRFHALTETTSALHSNMLCSY